MNMIHAVALGVVEGITEFLPVSSTAHLIITSKILNLPQTDYQKFFDVFIQAGAILAVVGIFFTYIRTHGNEMKKIMISYIPTALIGFVLYKIIKTVFFNSTELMIGTLSIIGFIFIIIELLIKKKKIILHKTFSDVTYADALLIGLCQACAVVPGVSRAGIVMLVMIARGYKREDAASYSFILAVPTILSASFYDFYKMRETVFSAGPNAMLLVVGFIASFLSAFMIVRWFIGFLRHNSLTSFGIYRIVLAIIIMLV